jgi:rubrerythrin
MTSDVQCSLEMLATALEMEEKGRAFYEKALATAQDPLGREMFTSLAQEEVVHTARIKQLHDTLTTGRCWTRDWEKQPKPEKDLGGLFRKLASQEKEKITAATSDLQAIDIGLDFESASVAFYEAQRATAKDPLEKEFLDQMILEEKSHLQALKDTWYYLTDPEGWFMEKERAGLEGT